MPVVGQRLVVGRGALDLPLLHGLLHHAGGAVGNAGEGEVVGEPLQLVGFGQHAEVVGPFQCRQGLGIVARLHVHGRELGPVLLLLRVLVHQGGQHLGGRLVLFQLVVGRHLQQVPGLRRLARGELDRVVHCRNGFPVLLELHMGVGQGDVGVRGRLLVLAEVCEPLLHGVDGTLEVPLRHVELGQVVAHLLGHRGRQAAGGDGVGEVLGRLTVLLLLGRHEAQGLQNDPLVVDPLACAGQRLLQLGIRLAVFLLGDQRLGLVDRAVGAVRQGGLLGGPAGGTEQHRHGHRGEDQGM